MNNARDDLHVRIRGLLAIASVLTATAGVTTVVVDQLGDSGPRYPKVQVTSTRTGYAVRWTNSTSRTFDPLTVHTVLYARDGKFVDTFLNADVDSAPGCCSISLPPGGSADIHLPKPQHKVAWIEFVDLYYGGVKTQLALPRVLCHVGRGDRITCRQEN